MKKLYSLAAAFAIASVSFAQADFQKGENVAAKLGLGDVDGMSFSGTVSKNSDEARPHDKVVETLGNYWKVDGDLPNEFLESFDEGRGIYGFYDKKTADMYQVVKFPAGSYTVKVQALYREGTPADNFTNHFNKKFTKYGHLYADCLTSENPASSVSRSFDRVLCTLAESDQHTQLYKYDDSSWMNDFKYEYKTTNAETGEQEVIEYYVPQCLVGLKAYFAQEKYYNTMRIVVTEPTYIRLGFRKTGFITADWLVFTNLQVIYDGEANDEAKVELAKEELEAAISNLEDVKNDLNRCGYEGLVSQIRDIISDANDVKDTGESTEARIIEEMNKVTELVNKYQKYYLVCKNLYDLVSQCEDMIVSTSFPALDTYKTQVSECKDDAFTDDAEVIGEDPIAYYTGVYNKLAKARADYLNSQEKDADGAKDFSSLVKNGWFVNTEYIPSYNSDNGTWTLSESTWGWGDVQAQGSYNSKKNGRTDICSKVTLYTSDDVTNEWYKKNAYTGWSSGIELFYQSGLIGVSDGWNSLASGTIGIEQQLVGLPKGYYSLKALGRGNDGDKAWDGKSREIYAQNSDGDILTSETLANDKDRPNTAQWGFGEWNPNGWTEIKTAVISALDGKLTIGGRCSKVANWTGFRLFFYGEELDFSKLIQEDIDILLPKLPNLTFEGDTLQIRSILNEIQFPITGSAAYSDAVNILNRARKYYDDALVAQKAYTAVETIVPLNTDDHKFIDPAYQVIIEFGGPNDTYDKSKALNEIADAYKSYIEIYDVASKFDDASLKAIIAEQTAAMAKEIQSVETIKKYLADLAFPYNFALLASKGAANASETNPVNVREIIVNGDFTDDATTGWTGETPSNNEYSYDIETGKMANAELWNKSAFTLSQTIDNLPAGKYEVRVKAIYRDGGSVTADLVNAYNDSVAAGKPIANQNAFLFANANGDKETEARVALPMIESLKYAENSFTEYSKKFDTETLEGGVVKVVPTDLYALAGTEKTYDGDNYGTDAEEGAYPFDTKVDFEGVGSYYYPASMQGFLNVCKKHGDDVTVKVQVVLAENGSITIGLDKVKAIGSDWVIFDDFELLYLDGEAFKKVADGIKVVEENVVPSNGTFNMAGQRVNDNFKGLVIKNGKKFYVK